MKTLITAAVVSLATANAAAFDFYAGFSGPDNDLSYSPAHKIEDPQASPVATRVQIALDELLAGNPDSDRRGSDDYVAIVDPTAPINTSLDILTHGNPDSGTGVRLKGRPVVEVGNIIAARVPSIEPGV